MAYVGWIPSFGLCLAKGEGGFNVSVVKEVRRGKVANLVEVIDVKVDLHLSLVQPFPIFQDHLKSHFTLRGPEIVT